MALPKPVLSGGDVVEVQNNSYESARLIWDTWSQDPIKAAVLQPILSCQYRLRYYPKVFRGIISVALGQNRVRFLHQSSFEVQEVHYLNIFRIPPKLGISSLFSIHILPLGGHLLAMPMFKRKACTWAVLININVTNLLRFHIA